MSWTIEDLAALDKAIASGTKSVRHGETHVIYQDTSSMVDARNRILDYLVSQGLITAGPLKRYFGRAVAKYNPG